MSRKILISYLAAFTFGVGATIGLSSFYNTAHNEYEPLLSTDLEDKQSNTSINSNPDNHQKNTQNSAATPAQEKPLITTNNNEQLIALQHENTQLKQQVEQLTDQLEQRIERIKNTLQESPIMKTFKEDKIKLAQLKRENTRLMTKLAQYDPELVASTTLTPENKAQLPKKISDRFEQMSFEHRTEIANFVNQKDEFNEGSNMAQKMLDFIAMHPESYNIKNQSVICKQNQCEIYIENSIGMKELQAQNYTQEQIKEHIQGLRTHNSYKNIIYELMSQFNLRHNIHRLDPFSGYYLLTAPTPA